MTKTTKDIAMLITIIVLLIFLIGIGPILTLLSLNTLFNLQIPYTFWSWLSVSWLQFILIYRYKRSD